MKLNGHNHIGKKEVTISGRNQKPSFFENLLESVEREINSVTGLRIEGRKSQITSPRVFNKSSNYFPEDFFITECIQ